MSEYAVFTKEMKKDYTILVPTMLPVHFKMIVQILNLYGYKAELLENMGSEIKQLGLKYVHNDTCYPAQLVIGQMLDAINSGKYDTHKIALMISQTGGGCRASNYIFLLRKALEKAGLGYIPVISFNVSGLDNNSGFKLTLPMIYRMMYAALYGDLIMLLKNQCKPYELVDGDTDKLVDRWTKRLVDDMSLSVRYSNVKRNYREIIRSFDAIGKTGQKRKVRVGVVGEIFVKFSPLGNNNLEEFLMSENAEVVMPGLTDFALYCIYNSIVDTDLYGEKRLKQIGAKILDKFILKKQNDLIRIIREESKFDPMSSFAHTRTLAKDYINLGAKMGEGWLLTAEMLELIEQGVNNIVCAQPFGCLPNHIVGKGMMKPIKERHPNVNIAAIDYDSGTSVINQQNRIKLMLATAAERERLSEKHEHESREKTSANA